MSDPVPVKKTSPWLQAVASYRAIHGCTYRDAMKGAAETFEKAPGSKPRTPQTPEQKAKASIRRKQKKLAELTAKLNTIAVTEDA